MALITLGDVADLRYKLLTRGWDYVAGKLRWRRSDRVRATYTEDAARANVSFWWDVPAVQQRWNEKISGDPAVGYHDHVERTVLRGRDDVRILSLGCGRGGNERNFAGRPGVSRVVGLDLVEACVADARRAADDEGLRNVEFLVQDMEAYEPDERFDVVLFNMSLHHFRPLERLLGELVPRWLRSDGVLVVNEFVGPTRWQWTRSQMACVDELLATLPDHLRRRRGTNSLKRRVHRPGLLRMLMNDPSESVRSGDIMPLLHRDYEIVEERPYGGNVLALLLTDIAHAFVPTGDPSLDSESAEHLHRLFDEEDRFVEREGRSDYVFGVYRPRAAVEAVPRSEAA